MQMAPISLRDRLEERNLSIIFTIYFPEKPNGDGQRMLLLKQMQHEIVDTFELTFEL